MELLLSQPPDTLNHSGLVTLAPSDTCYMTYSVLLVSLTHHLPQIMILKTCLLEAEVANGNENWLLMSLSYLLQNAIHVKLIMGTDVAV